MFDLDLRIRRVAWELQRIPAFFRVGSLTLAEIRREALGLWSWFNVDDGLVTYGLFPWEEDILNPAARAGQRVLIVGCGSGRDVIPLLARGAIVTGVDPSPEALSALRAVLAARQLSATLIEGFIEDVTVSGPFDLIYFSYYCYAYMPGRSRRLATLRTMTSHLAPGGEIVVSAPIGVGVSPILTALARFSGALFRTDWRFEPDDNVWLAETTAGRGHYQHAFRPGALEEELRDAGLVVKYRNPDAVLAAPGPGATQ